MLNTLVQTFTHVFSPAATAPPVASHVERSNPIGIIWPSDPVEWVSGVGILLTFVATILFGRKGVHDSKETRSEVERLRKLTIRPRLNWHLELPPEGDGGYVLVHIGNAGGSCDHGCLVLHYGAVLFMLENIQVPEHSPKIEFKANSVASQFPYVQMPRTLLFICQDIEGTWWDWSTAIGKPLKDVPPDLPTTPAFRAWVRQRLAATSTDRSEEAASMTADSDTQAAAELSGAQQPHGE